MRTRTPLEKLTDLVDKRGRADVLAQSGLSKQYLSNLLSGKAKFGEAAQVRLESLLGLPDRYFRSDTPNAAQAGRLPVLSMAEVGNTEPAASATWAPFPAELCKPGHFAVLLDSISLASPHPGERGLPAGAHIAIDPSRNPKHGDFVLARLPGQHQAVLRKLIEDGGGLYLTTLHPDMRELTKVTPAVSLLGTACGYVALL